MTRGFIGRVLSGSHLKAGEILDFSKLVPKQLESAFVFSKILACLNP